MWYKRIITVAAAVLIASVSGANAQDLTGIGISSYSISSIWPSSFRSVKGKVEAVFNNSGEARKVSGIHAVVFRSGQEFAEGTCDDVFFPAGQSKSVLSGEVRLSEGVSVFSAIGAVLSFHPEEYTVNVYMTLERSDGTVKSLQKIGIPATRFFKR